MNTKTLSKHYYQLTPAERLSLIQAATEREDDIEWHRLMDSAPKVTYCVPHTFGIAKAFQEVATLYFIELLDIAGRCLELRALADTDDNTAERFFRCARIAAYIFGTKLAGWRQFCAAHQFEDSYIFSLLPGVSTLRRAEQFAESFVIDGGEVKEYFAEADNEVSELITVESTAADLESVFRSRVVHWE